MIAQDVLRDGWCLRGSVRPLGAGIINDTYIVTNIGKADEVALRGHLQCSEATAALRGAADGLACASAEPSSRSVAVAGEDGLVAGDRLVLQCVNPSVFPNAGLLMDNVARVSAHLCTKQRAWTPSLVPTTGGDSHALAGDQSWRLWTYLPGAGGLGAVATDRQAHTLGAGFGTTYRWLQDLPGPRLADAIPGFLQLEHYLNEFDNRSGAPRELCAAIDQRRSLTDRFRNRTGYIHGDCRVEHLVLSDAGEATGVLDLDTVMWGNWAWEFGDLVRAMSSERLVPSRFEAAARGYIGEARVAATAEDLVLAPRYTTFMLGVRFLSDYLNGDRYFKTSKPGENLERARAQFRLLESMEALEAEMLRRAQSAVEIVAASRQQRP